MIDLSYLTEDEQGAIMSVLQRDTELKKAEEERVKHLQKQGPEESKLKYITGAWFYEVKSQRHQDRIHGSDIIAASMKQKKTETVERPSKTNNQLMTLQPKSTDNLKERRPTDTLQQRHNPFNNMSVDLDFDLISEASLPDTTGSPAELLPSSPETQGTKSEASTKVLDIVQETSPYQKPVPKKRTKLFKVQKSGPDSTSSISTQSVSTKSSMSTQSASTNSSVSTQSVSTSSSTKSPVSTPSMSANSDSRSTLSTQSMSTNSETRPFPLKGILKHRSSLDSSDSNIKNRLPVLRKSLRKAPTKTVHGHILEEKAISQKRIEDCLNLKDTEPQNKFTLPTLPKSRLPVQASMLLNDPKQTGQEKPVIQPHMSLSSSTLSNDEQRTSDILPMSEYENYFNWSISAEPEKQQTADEIMKKPLSIAITKAKSPFESLLVKPINKTPLISLKNQEKEDSTPSMSENEMTEGRLHHPLSIKDQVVYEATNPTDAYNSAEPSHMPCTFDAKTTQDPKINTEDRKRPLMVNSKSPKGSEEGDSIAKVLEWFSRSSDSSDKPDREDIITDTEVDIKIEDVDFEDELDPRPNAENNVYLIISKHRDEDEAVTNDAFLEDKVSETEPNVDKKEPSMNSQADQKIIEMSKLLGSALKIPALESSLFRHTSPEETTTRLFKLKKTSPSVKTFETYSNKEEHRHTDMAETIPDTKPNGQELPDHEDSLSPNVANIRLVWDQCTIEEPVMLVSKPNYRLENINQLNGVVKECEGPENKDQSHVKNILNADIQPNNSTCEHLNKEKVVGDVAKDIEAPMSDLHQIKDGMCPSTASDKDATRSLVPSSLNFGLQIGEYHSENAGGNVNSCKETAAVSELEAKVKAQEKETQLNPPPSEVKSQKQTPVPLAKQIRQQENHRAERITELKSLWEQEKSQSKECISTANDTKSSVTDTKLNKRFTKSEYDLRSIGTESKAEASNFTVLPLRDRIEKTLTAEGMNNLQFKNLLEFWGGSSKKSPHLESTTQNLLNQEFKCAKPHKLVTKLELVDAKDALKQDVCPKQSENRFGNKSENFEISACSESAGMLNKQSPQQTRGSGRGSFHSRGNSLRRAASMFTINLESGDQDLPLQSKTIYNTVPPALENTSECIVLPSTDTPGVDLQVKKSPVITKSKQKVTVSTFENPDSHPLARSFVPQDQHNLGITENTGTDISSQDTQQMSELVCTSFQTEGSVRCRPDEADSPIDSAELWPKRKSLGLHASEDVNPETLNRPDSFSAASANFTEVSLVQEVLKRASSRPVTHKSLEDISAVPRCSTPSPSSFFDNEHLRKISKSVPYFLDNENYEDESDSECSSHSSKYWKNDSLQHELNSNSHVATVSSMSASAMNLSSADFRRFEVQGTIQFSINYVQKRREFHIFVVQCQNLAAVDVKRNRSDPYIKSYLIPDTANLGKRKTSVKKKTLNPIYNEILKYRVQMEYLKTQMLNLSVWHNDTFGRNSFLGEIELDLFKWDFKHHLFKCLPLKPRTISSLLSTDDRGEMRLAIRFLCYISSNKSSQGLGEIHIWVRDCKNLPQIRGVAINSYVKILMLTDTNLNSCQKTRVLKRTSSPVFNHTLVYDGVKTGDLKEACVELTVWNHDRLADDLVGGLRLSLGTGTEVDQMDCTEKEKALWQRMMDSPNEWVEDVLPLRVLISAEKS